MQPGKQTLQNAAHDDQLSECNEQENGNFIVLCKAIFGFLSQFVPMQEEGITSLVSVKGTAVNQANLLALSSSWALTHDVFLLVLAFIVHVMGAGISGGIARLVSREGGKPGSKAAYFTL
jgi:hypothetical protein